MINTFCILFKKIFLIPKEGILLLICLLRESHNPTWYASQITSIPRWWLVISTVLFPTVEHGSD